MSGKSSRSLSIVIPTYGREQVLLDTLEAVLEQAGQCEGFAELLVIDQTQQHEKDTASRLGTWDETGRLRWLRLEAPHLTRAMNLGLIRARGDLVLFLDDDIIPAPGLLAAHRDAHRMNGIWAVVGQILQPGETAERIAYEPSGGMLYRYLDFPFRRDEGAYIENIMAGNLSVNREKAIAVGGFDENIPPPVAARFETEFAKRLVNRGGRIWFEPSASIRHLQVLSGGTRTLGSHMASASPLFGVGDYYYALRQGRGREKWRYVLRKPFREVRTRFHLKHPWWIPVKLVGELRAYMMAARLIRRRPRLIGDGE